MNEEKKKTIVVFTNPHEGTRYAGYRDHNGSVHAVATKRQNGEWERESKPYPVISPEKVADGTYDVSVTATDAPTEPAAPPGPTKATLSPAATATMTEWSSARIAISRPAPTLGGELASPAIYDSVVLATTFTAKAPPIATYLPTAPLTDRFAMTARLSACSKIS